MNAINRKINHFLKWPKWGHGQREAWDTQHCYFAFFQVAFWAIHDTVKYIEEIHTKDEKTAINLSFVMFMFQVVGPADGSDYVMGYRTPRFSRMWVNNETYFHSSDLWWE